MNYVGIDWAYGSATWCAMGETGTIAGGGMIPAEESGLARLGKGADRAPLILHVPPHHRFPTTPRLSADIAWAVSEENVEVVRGSYADPRA